MRKERSCLSDECQIRSGSFNRARNSAQSTNTNYTNTERHKAHNRTHMGRIVPYIFQKSTLDIVLASCVSEHPISYLRGHKQKTRYQVRDIFDIDRQCHVLICVQKPQCIPEFMFESAQNALTKSKKGKKTLFSGIRDPVWSPIGPFQVQGPHPH